MLGEDVGSRELPSSPHGWVHGVPRQGYPHTLNPARTLKLRIAVFTASFDGHPGAEI